MEKFILKIKRLLTEDRLGDAINEILKLIQGNPDFNRLSNDLLLLSARYNTFKRNLSIGIVSNSEGNVTINQINAAFLGILEEFEKVEQRSEHPIFPQTDDAFNKKEKAVWSESKEDSILEHKIKILFLAASPDDKARIRVDEEMRQVSLELSNARYRDKFKLEKFVAVRLDDLLNELLNNPPNFIHFAGHGSKEGLFFVEDTLRGQEVKGHGLAKLFKMFTNDIACVFFNSCYSEWQGKEIIKVIPKVIGMNDEVEDEIAIRFAKNFYKSIGAGKDIDFAFEFAKISTGLYHERGESIPVLLSRGS